MHRLFAIVVAGLLLVAAGCGDDEPADPDAPEVPDKGDEAVLGIPLPRGVVEQAGPEGADVYRARKLDSLRGLQAFFGEEVGGKALRGHAWCGATSNAENTKHLFVWRKPDNGDVIRVFLDGTDPSAGVLITVAAEKGAPELLCPPEPVDSIPGDPGDIPGV